VSAKGRKKRDKKGQLRALPKTEMKRASGKSNAPSTTMILAAFAVVVMLVFCRGREDKTKITYE